MEEVRDYEIENESETTDTNTRKKPISEETILTLNEYFRVLINSNNPSMELEKKKKYDDGTEGWTNDGFFGWFDSLLWDVGNSMTKQKLCKKSQTDIVDLRNAILEVKQMIEEWIGISKKEIKKKLEDNT